MVKLDVVLEHTRLLLKKIPDSKQKSAGRCWYDRKQLHVCKRCDFQVQGWLHACELVTSRAIQGLGNIQ